MRFAIHNEALTPTCWYFLESKAKTLWLAPLPNADLARAGMLKPWTIAQEQEGCFSLIRIMPSMCAILSYVQI